MLTEDDDLIRAQDVPERMQLATSSLSPSLTLSSHKPMLEDDIDEAAQWITPRLSPKKTREYFHPEGGSSHLQNHLVLAVSSALKFLFVQEFEVPYIWTHKRDHISYFDVKDIRTRVELISLSELWRIYTLGQKYRALVERRQLLEASYARLDVVDGYYQDHVRPKLTGVEVIADATEWLAMKYKGKKQDRFDFHFHDDEDQGDSKKRKLPSRISAYEVAKKSIVAKLAKVRDAFSPKRSFLSRFLQGYGIQPHDVVLNFVAQHQTQYVEDQELNPIAFAEQFADPEATKAQPPERLLASARMILATELGKDPLLRQAMRDLFQVHAQISVLPTERGITKIDEHHPYFVSVSFRVGKYVSPRRTS
jgi:transcription elongation factor SPT6